MSQPQRQENKMGTMPMNRLLLNMAVPMMISMLVQALYNVVDSIFVSYISENALSALSLAFPIQNLMIGCGTGIGVGMNALLSRSLGAKDTDRANRVGANGVFLAFCSGILFLLFGLFLPRAFMESQTDIPEIIDFGTSYLRICSMASMGLFGQIIYERLLQSTGKTQLSMYAQLTGAITNIILDPIFIFVLDWGVIGAACATVVGQIFASVVAILLNTHKNKELHISFRKFRPEGSLIRAILVIGVPSILMVGISSIMTYTMNRILIAFTSTAVAVFGAYFKLQSFIFMPIFGLNNGMIPIIAYNYGAKLTGRMKQVIRLGILYAVGIMLIGLLLFQFAPDKLLSMFDASPEMLAVGIPALRTISLSYLFAGFCIIVSGVFQALGRSIYSTLISGGRQLLILLPAAYLLSLSGNVNLIWFSFPIAELMSLLLSAIFLVKIMRHISEKIAPEHNA